MFNISLKLRSLMLLAIAIILPLTACNTPSTRPTPNPQTIIDNAVAATLAAVPEASPYPSPTAYPSPTTVPLNGLFCEYGFCIGHPADMILFDQGALQKPPVIGTHSNGILLGYTDSLYIQLNWQISDPNFNPQTAMTLILEETQTLQGNLDVLLIGNLNVYYQPSTTVTPVLPYGAIAVWQCGGRDFIWKIYTPQDNMAQGLLKQFLARFRCE